MLMYPTRVMRIPVSNDIEMSRMNLDSGPIQYLTCHLVNQWRSQQPSNETFGHKRVFEKECVVVFDDIHTELRFIPTMKGNDSAGDRRV